MRSKARRVPRAVIRKATRPSESRSEADVRADIARRRERKAQEAQVAHSTSIPGPDGSDGSGRLDRPSRPVRGKAGSRKPAGRPSGNADARNEARPPRSRSQSTGPSARRKSFSQRNLALTVDGPLGSVLGEALTVPEESGYGLTHAFHPYPGRFHPALPRLVLKAVAQPKQQILDPFMGGGTTLVEAMLQGLRASGNDLNPVATLVARERTRPRTADQARPVDDALRRIAALVEAIGKERGKRRHGDGPSNGMPRIHLPHQGRLSSHYQPHLLAELMQWLRLINDTRDSAVRETLRAVFSSAVVKFSNVTSDSRTEPGTPPRFGKGAVSRFLLAKGRELLAAQRALCEQLPPGTPAPVLYTEDARLLPSLGWGTCDVVLTSPPYPGTYDYHAQHRLRMDWLALDDAPFETGEIGSRRRHISAANGEPSGDGWSESLRDVLGTVARVLKPGGPLLLVMGDWIAREHAVDAVAQLSRAAQASGWKLDSRASVQREVHSRVEAKAFAKRGKWEHLLCFRREGAVAEAPKPKRERSKGGRIRVRQKP